MNFGNVLMIIFLAVAALAFSSNSETLLYMLQINAVVQLALFILVACIPFLKTGRMSYVDIAWPFGVALIGLQIILLGDGDAMRQMIVGGVYLLIGLRMGMGALVMGKATGVIFKTEFPRYQYRLLKLKEEKSNWIRFHMLTEIMAQGFANITVLAIPGFMMAINSNDTLSYWEVVGIALWGTAYLLETTADLQKLRFMTKKQGDVCNVGLWRYSRHPNYFSEWLVWTGLVIAAVPSWLALQGTESLSVWVALGVGAVMASVMLYITLVYLTGAIPAEYYSVKKRPGYKAYQEQTNRFFPWFPK
mgnify:FL=1